MNPSSYRSRLSALTAAALLVAMPALADWSADIRLKTAPVPGQPASPEMKGKMYGRKSLLRMDMEMPAEQAAMGRMSMIFDWEKRTGTMLMHAQKLATQRSLDEMAVKLPGACTGKGKDFDACFKAQGYKKTGTEKVNGHPATIYEGNVPGQDGKPARQRVWRPTDLPEVPYVRSETYDTQGAVVTELDVLNVQVGPQPDSLFTVPSDYQQMAPPPAPMMRQRMSPAPKPQGQ